MAKKSNGISGWVGWVYFAGILLALVGFFEAIAGFAALLQDEYIVVKPVLTITFSTTAWGWTHLLIGIILVLAGFAILAGKMWGRVVGIILAFISAVVNFMFIPTYPVWSIIVVVIDICIIYALVAHGAEAAELE